MNTPEGSSVNKRFKSEERIKIRSKKGVKCIPVVDLSGTEEAPQSNIQVDTDELLEFVRNAPKINMKEGKRSRGY